MAEAASSKQAAAYLIDPLTAPEPAAETGPGASIGNVAANVAATNRESSSTTTTLPHRSGHRTTASTSSRHSRHASNGSPGEKFPNYRTEALGQLNDTPPTYDAGQGSSSSGRRRKSSLKERFPGDQSASPLDVIRRDSKRQNKPAHLSKRHIPGPDSIDRLDPAIIAPYHHEGPYDAASMARNNNVRGDMGPIAALRTSNAEALRATPPENIKNSLDKHVPLDGTAVIPPGQQDRLGRRLNYEEGPNMMFDGLPDGGQYKRYEGVEYRDDDIHGKGEPFFSRDQHMRKQGVDPGNYEDNGAIELQDRKQADVAVARDADVEGRQRSGSHSLKDGLKRRIGSLRRKPNHDE